MDDIIHGRYRKWGKEAEHITQWQFSPRLQWLRTEVLLYLWIGLFFVLSNFLYTCRNCGQINAQATEKLEATRKGP